MDKCVILQRTVSHVGFSYGTVWHVVVDMLGMPCVLTDDNKVTRMMACQFPATLHSRRKQLYVCQAVNGDETHGLIISLPPVSN